MTKLTLDTSVNKIPLVGPIYVKRLERLNIFSISDLLHHYPSRHDDLSVISKISSVRPNQIVTIKAKVLRCQNIFTKNRKRIQKAVVKDSSGSIEVIWFNQIYIPNTLKEGTTVSFSGKVGWFDRKLTLISPQYEIIGYNNKSLHTGRLVPVYPETAKLSSKWLRSRINFCLDNLKTELKKDWLPEDLRKKHQLIKLNTALSNIHFPSTQNDLITAQDRLAFNEMFLLQLEALQRKKSWQQKKLSHQLSIDQEKVLKLISSLPFKLTQAQNKCIKEILADLNQETPMNRLLQGDVGSGKTVVAAMAIYISFLNSFQSVLMAPTEILANQHFKTLKTVFANTNLKINLITSSTRKTNTNADVLVGTHALLFRELNLKKIGLYIIDEQHRFGVKQRSQFSNLSHTPHLLTMTATPIPRTIALTAYADLDLSILDQMPPGRKPIKTWVVPKNKHLDAYHWISSQIKADKSQAFVVCPLIEASDKEKMADVKNVTDQFNQLKSIFPKLKLDLLHGKLKSNQKESIIKKFSQKKLNLLVSTSVIEVGIDIPNATIMVVEDAERFGLAQLHQLRGRVGRANKQSYCLLLTDAKKPETIQRLKFLEIHQSGLKLAELDLKLRGPGDLYGLKQHGFLDLKLASFTDTKLVKTTQQAAHTQLTKITPALKKLLKKRKIHFIAQN